MVSSVIDNEGGVFAIALLLRPIVYRNGRGDDHLTAAPVTPQKDAQLDSPIGTAGNAARLMRR